MGKISIEFDSNVPRFSCTSCYSCTSLMGQSLCSVKNRGCCWYYPKFTLVEIQRMSKSLEGLRTLDTIRKNPFSTTYQYYIHAKGYMDKGGYENYLKESYFEEASEIKDRTIFFRACPFVKDGQGCTLQPRYRTHVCNFFICSEVVKEANKDGSYQRYLKECSSYAVWLSWENSALEHVLAENGVNLVNNFDKAIVILQSLPQNEFEFTKLDAIEYSETCSVVGA